MQHRLRRGALLVNPDMIGGLIMIAVAIVMLTVGIVVTLLHNH